MLSAHTAVGTSFSRQDSQDGPFSAEGESSPKGSAVFAATTALQMQLTASVGNLETLEYGEASQASQNSGGDAADPCSHGEPPSDEDMEENSASVLNGAIAALAGSGAAIFEGKSDNGPGGSAAPSGAQDVYSIMQKQGTLMAFWGQPKKRAPDVDPEAPTPAKRTALTPAPAAASVGSPLLQAHCASRQ